MELDNPGLLNPLPLVLVDGSPLLLVPHGPDLSSAKAYFSEGDGSLSCFDPAQPLAIRRFDLHINLSGAAFISNQDGTVVYLQTQGPPRAHASEMTAASLVTGGSSIFRIHLHEDPPRVEPAGGLGDWVQHMTHAAVDQEGRIVGFIRIGNEKELVRLHPPAPETLGQGEGG